MKPMLADAVEPEKNPLRFPVYASVKIDGVRAYNENGILFSRSGKLIRNDHIQRLLGVNAFNGLDGELCVGNPWDQNLMQQTTSGVMSEHGQPNFTWQIFDIWNINAPYITRFGAIENAFSDKSDWAKYAADSGIRIVQQSLIRDQVELDAYEAVALAMGYEGVMVRDPQALYKHGRSTAKQQGLLKLKRWISGEAIVEDFEEQLFNGNEAFLDELGKTKRSTHQANMVGKNTLGVLICRDLVSNNVVRVGTGFDDLLRKEIWTHPLNYKGRIVTYKHFAQSGVKDKARMPIFVGFRHLEDM